MAIPTCSNAANTGCNSSDASIPTYKVSVIHGVEEPRVDRKQVYEAAHALYVNECGNAARVLAITPGLPVNIQLIGMDGEVMKSLVICKG